MRGPGNWRLYVTEPDATQSKTQNAALLGGTRMETNSFREELTAGEAEELVAATPSKWARTKLEIVSEAQRESASYGDACLRCDDDGDVLAVFCNFGGAMPLSATDGLQRVATFTYDAACKTIVYQRPGMPPQLLRLIAMRNAIGFVRGREGLSLANFLSEFSEYLGAVRSTRLRAQVA